MMQKNTDNDNEEQMSIGDIVYIIIFVVLCIAMIVAAVVGILYAGKNIKDNTDEIKQMTEEIHTTTIPLQSISVTTRTEGSFYYGVGKVGEKEYYVAYRILDDGGKQLYKMEAAITIIYDTLNSGQQAYVEEDANAYGVKAYRLYVPQNAIEQKYDLSLE